MENECAKNSQVNEQMEKIEDSIKTLGEVIQVLEARLVKVLRQEAEKPVEKGSVSEALPILCPLASQLRDKSRTISVCIRDLSEIKERVEL
jgi:hypothetical protein